MANKQTALIVGASRGLGFALAEEWLGRDWRVIATARSRSESLEALAGRYPDSLEIEHVDIADGPSVAALRERLGDRGLDVLFVNAGISRANGETTATAEEPDFVAMMLTNALSPVRVVEHFADLVPPDGVIAVMTSELGSIANNQGFWELYSASKAALNMLMKCYAGRHQGDPRAMLLVAPGWVRTEMGGPGALLSIEESIPQVVDMVTRSRGVAGLRYVDRFGRMLPW